ncbi:MAG: SMC family ATPase [Bacteroidota bacterium]
MTPVRLRLKNFLSYGEAAPELDFEGLHVACLSGGNGQGKSALLDAITWALWGEARKSADSRKPDDDLLRIGAREMEVELTFDLADQRYRVRRSYTKTASGKSSKPGLEVQARLPDADDWRPLTETSIRETQAVLEARLGVDYETFVNSTFLLQGRSDEFTRKKPTERKQILTRILDLGRYDRLHERASRRYSEARERVKSLEAESSRLVTALEEEDTWKAEAEAVEQTVRERGEALSAARDAEAEAQKAVDAIERREAEAGRARQSVVDLNARLTRLAADESALRERLTEAEELTERAEDIERDHARFEALRTERVALDEKATLHHAVRQRVQELRHELDRARRDLESEVAALERRIADDRSRLTEDRERMGALERVEAELKRASEAEIVASRLAERKAERDRLQQRADALQKRLDAHAQRLDADRTNLRAQIREADERLSARGALREEATRLVRDAERHHSLLATMEQVTKKGASLTETIGRAEADQAALARERASVEAKRDKILGAEEGDCPTCGTPLTPEHRRDVVEGYEQELAALARRNRTLTDTLADLVRQRDELRREYAQHKAEAAPLAEATTARARVEERLQTLDALAGRLEVKKAEHEQLDASIRAGTFLPDVRAERDQIDRSLTETTFDESAYEAARTAAALRGHFSDERRTLLGLAERVEAEASRLGAEERRLGVLRETLASGSAFAQRREALAAQERQLAAIGFDAERFESVQREMRELEGVPAQVARLAEAVKTLRRDTPRLGAFVEDIARLRTERQTQQATLAEIEAGLADREGIRAQHAESSRKRTGAEASLAEAQTRLGALRERLDRAARDREALKNVRRDLREAKKKSQLYYQLRVAFGKNGIPSLIIEETLPEIESRANEVLGRLTNGRTRVALETLKEKKTGGGTKETLDIRITDEAGVSRPYETFSGGEAFRVNFALRIALSQMLAERSGTQIRTLVVDEGFGTQDKEGIAALVEAIHAIQDDFDTILVVTHLDEMKDAFPVRIEVTKRPVEGSTFEIVGV